MDLNEKDEKPDAEEGGDASRRSPAGADRDVGQALRSVYTETVAEDIPSDILDLLGRLD